MYIYIYFFFNGLSFNREVRVTLRRTLVFIMSGEAAAVCSPPHTSTVEQVLQEDQVHGAGTAGRPVTLGDADVRAAAVVTATRMGCWEDQKKQENIHRCYWLVAKQNRSVKNIFGPICSFTSKSGLFLVLFSSVFN